MCHDPDYVDRLQADLHDFTVRAKSGDEQSARAAEQTALELELLGIRPLGRSRRVLADPRREEVSPQRTRMGFAS